MFESVKCTNKSMNKRIGTELIIKIMLQPYLYAAPRSGNVEKVLLLYLCNPLTMQGVYYNFGVYGHRLIRRSPLEKCSELNPFFQLGW